MQEEKYALITGATSGIGRAAAIQLADQGYSLLILARNKSKFMELREELVQKTRVADERIRLILCNLASMSSVRTAGREILELNTQISILINNAGSYHWKRETTEDGFEATFAVCYLSHFLLTNTILNCLKHTEESRIINLASNIHMFFGINWNDIMTEKKYQSQKAYGASKTAMVLFTHALARRLERTNIRVHAVHPGHVRTNMTTGNAKGAMKFFMNIMPGYQSSEQAASYVVNAAINSNYSARSDLYFIKDKVGKAKKATYSHDLQEQLWRLSNELLGTKFS